MATTKEKTPTVLTETQLLKMSADDYMNDDQQAFFRAKLEAMRAEVLGRETDARERLRTIDESALTDMNDRATSEESAWLDLRLREREAFLLSRVQKSIDLLDSGDYGYCEATGEEIGLQRLLVRPTATLSVAAKEVAEMRKRSFRDTR